MSTEVDSAPPPPTLPEDATARLMRMLESVRLEKSEESVPVATAKLTTCPECGSEESWGNSSWCPECGYYPKLGRAMTPVEIEGNQAKSQPVSLQWLIWLNVGLTLMIGISVALLFLVPDEVQRAQFGRMQCVLGLTLLLVAQVRAYVASAHGTDAVPISAIFFEPVQLWMAVFRQIPKTRHAIYFGVWGLAGLIMALTVTGMDFDGMFPNGKKKKKKNVMQTMVKAISAAADGKSAFSNSEEGDGEGGEEAPSGGGTGPRLGGSGGNIEGAMKDFAGSAGADNYVGGTGGGPGPGGQGAAGLDEKSLAAVTNGLIEQSQQPVQPVEKKIPLSPSGLKRADRADFVIFGYLTNPAGEIKSILLADVGSSRARFVGKMSLDELSEEEREQLQGELDQIRSARSAMKTPYQARWVRPLVLANVAHAGWTPEGQVREGYLMSVNNQATRQAKTKQAARP